MYSCQSGHTFYDDQKRKIVNRQLPTSFANCKHIIIGPGALIKPHVLKEEVEMLENLGYDIRDRLYIDHSATVIPDNAHRFEKKLVKEIGSTGEGVGYAMQQRVMRTAKTVGDMKDFFNKFGIVTNVWTLYDNYKDVLLEGTQGFGLSLIHGQYPHVTSRDTSTGTLITGAALPINCLRDIYGVMRTYPIRVGTVVKTSGPMYKELSWKKIAKRAGYRQNIAEKTTVTGRIRRVGEIDYSMLYKAIKLTGANKLAVTFLNYLDADLENVDSKTKVLANPTAKKWLNTLKKGLKANIVYVSTNRYKTIKIKK